MSAGKSSSALRKVLGSDVLVVPCPRSAPLLPGALWPAKEICAALASHNLAAGVAEILERIKPVQKSSTALSKDRPKPEDCGGIGGYEDLLAALRDPKHEQHDEMVDWVGDDFDPEAFDLAAVNKALGRRKK